MKRIGMNDITDILRHRHGLGLTRDQIAAAVGVSSGTVSHVLERAAAAGLTWPLPEDIDDDALRARLYPPCERDSGHAQPDWDAVIKELEKPRTSPPSDEIDPPSKSAVTFLRLTAGRSNRRRVSSVMVGVALSLRRWKDAGKRISTRSQRFTPRSPPHPLAVKNKAG